MVDYPRLEDEAIAAQSDAYLFADFAISEAMQDFLNSDEGRYLQGVAQQEVAEAVQVFLSHNPRRSIDVVAAAHEQANRARESFRWILETLERGRQAEYQLRQRDDEERP